MYHCFRLKNGEDLKKEIENYVIDNNISGVILCCVGSLNKLCIRLADGCTIMTKEGMFEIVSITGSLSLDGVHIHISVTEENGNTIGGHLKDGCIINTTGEIVLLEMEKVNFKREFDSKTGYKELEINFNR